MPGKAVHRKSKPMGHLTAAAHDKNDRAICRVLEGDEGFFARVERNNGQNWKVSYSDGSKVYDNIVAKPRGVFGINGKVRVHISVGDIVLLDNIQGLKEISARGDSLNVEIIGCLDKKQAQKLYDSGRIPRSIYAASSEGGGEADPLADLFDYSGVEKENTPISKEKKVSKRAAAPVAKEEADSDVDIDDI